ncbi:protein sprint-like isoform X2 [Argopecten irradians]|uniref:protein sprint-like isoform X2 n=1 Tax=Argopecten irradians TaxID=31199 RepID=UPI0037232ED8
MKVLRMEDDCYDPVEPGDVEEYQPSSSYQKMLNNIANDLDLLLDEMCDIYPYPETTSNNAKFQSFVKTQQTYTDSSPGRGEDSAFGTLASTDSYSSEQKTRSDSLQSAHLDVFGLNNKGLEIPTYPDRVQTSGSDSCGSEGRNISFLERLTKTHAIWYLSDIGRSGAVHLLKDRDPGNFILRKSSQPQTLALSVQFPEKGVANVDHYLIMSTENGLQLQGSHHYFCNVANLLAFYHQNMEELPHVLTLPPTIMRARTLQELNSLSYLGQDFWTSYRFDKGSNASLQDNCGSRVHSTMMLHKSTSEPINIQGTVVGPEASGHVSLRPHTAQSLQHFPQHHNSRPISSQSSGSSREYLENRCSRSDQSTPNKIFSGQHRHSNVSQDKSSSEHDRNSSDLGSQLVVHHERSSSGQSYTAPMGQMSDTSHSDHERTTSSEQIFPVISRPMREDSPSGSSLTDSGKLKDRDPGNFILRKSSQPQTLALSVQFPEKGVANVDHYLIMSTENGLQLQGSHHYFCNVANLLAFYHQNMEELPHVLTLPPTIMRARTLQELNSLSYLGQDFWTSYRFDKGSNASLQDNCGSRVHSTMMLHKSTSEPINIQGTVVGPEASGHVSLRPHTAQSLQHFPQHHNSRPISSQSSGSSREYLENRCSRSDQSTPNKIFSGQHRHSNVSQDKSSSEHDRNSSDLGSQLVVHHERSSSGQSYTAPMGQMSDTSHSDHERTTSSEQIFPVISRPMREDSPSGSSLTDSGKVCDRCGGSSRSLTPHTLGSSSSLNSIDYNYREESPLSQTHPKPKSHKSNLYCTTSLDLLQLPENQYFKSNLSDKMSDYEDIWKNSTAPTPVPSLKCSVINTPVNSVKGSEPNTPVSCVSIQTDDYTKFHQTDNLNDVHVQKPQQSQKNIMYNLSQNDLNNRPDGSNVINVMPKRRMLRALSLDESNKQNNLSVPMQVDFVGFRAKSEQVIDRPKASVQTQTSPIHKYKPPSLHLHSNSSAASSVASGVKSPVYAEPFDALEPGQIQEQKPTPRQRRRSAPAMGANVQSRKVLGMSHNPKLETIFSPRVEEDSENFTFNQFGANSPAINPAMYKLPPSGGKQNNKKGKREKKWLSNLSVLSRDNVDEVVKKLETIQCDDQSISDTGKRKNGMPEMMVDGIAYDPEEQVTSTLRKFPVYQKQVSVRSCQSEYSTMEDIISNENPSLTVKPIPVMPVKNYRVLSEYDNLTNQYAPPSARSHTSTGTEFCKPWGNNFFESLLIKTNNPKLVPPMDVNERIQAWRTDSQKFRPVSSVRNSVISSSTLLEEEEESICDTPQPDVQPPPLPNVPCPTHTGEHHLVSSVGNKRRKASQDNDDQSEASTTTNTFHSMAPPKTTKAHIREASKSKSKSPETRIRDYITKLSENKLTTFGSTIANFIQCTIESPETNPGIVTRNVRQFMTGIRNYLVKHELEDVIETERTRLRSNEILNVDAIIERALHVCVLQPLKHHIYQLFVNEYTRNGSVRNLSENIRYARTKSPEEIGLRPGISPPDSTVMESIKQYLTKMQKAYSPLKKLEYLLSATAIIYQCTNKAEHSRPGPVPMGADDFLPMMIYVLVHCGFVTAEIESDYIWGLIHPSLLNGEGGYYLTSLSSAVLVLKKFRDMQETQTTQHEGHLPGIEDIQGFLKIAIPDELRDSIIWKTLPVRPKMHTKDVCTLIAHKFKVTNPQDYGLYILIKGEERRLLDAEIPQDLKNEHQNNKKNCVFAYKRTAANIAWPVSLQK